MNRRDQIAAIILAQLDYYAAPTNEAVLHADVNNRVQPHAAKSEFDAAIRYLDEKGFLTTIRRVGGVRYSLTDLGITEVQA